MTGDPDRHSLLADLRTPSSARRECLRARAGRCLPPAIVVSTPLGGAVYPPYSRAMVDSASTPSQQRSGARPAQRRRSAALATGLGVVALAGAAATLVLAVLNRSHLETVAAADLNTISISISAGVLGLLVARRRPRNPTGWLLLVIAATSALQGVEDQYTRFGLLTNPGSLPGVVWAEWLGSFESAVIFPAGVVLALLLLLPDGRLPSRRWRALIVAGAIDTLVMLVTLAFAPGPIDVAESTVNYPLLPNPLGVGALATVSNSNGPVSAALWLSGLAMLVAASVAPFLRMRRARGDERQQLKWIASAVLFSAVVVIPFVFLAGSVLPSWTFDIPIVLGFGFAFPLSIGIAIFKHRLYDIDVVISRALVYGSLAVFITAVYVGIAVGIGALVGGGGKPNLGLSILATAIVAVGFQPVRERVQRIANRLVYGQRATPYEVLAQFSDRVAESYATDDVMPRMARVLAEGTGAQRADVWLRSAGSWHQAAVWSEDARRAEPAAAVDGALPSPDHGNARSIEVRHQGDLLGALSITKRTGEALTPVEEHLLNDLAAQAGLVLRNVGLTDDLQARLLDLRASRQRLVTAQDEERRRLERNLHDGAQQHLVALKVKLGLVEMLVSRDPVKAKATLAQLKSDANEALETLRDLARGIYPPLLADKGLGTALRSQAHKATLPVTVDADGVGRYPQDIEAAVYFSVLEALQNVQKYAHATGAVVRLREDGGQLHFSVSDDGRGFEVATTARGSGLTNMADRLDALGGTVTLRSAPGQGTELSGALPVIEAEVTVEAASMIPSAVTDMQMEPVPASSA
jgi:signal transduction histidine kinase